MDNGHDHENEALNASDSELIRRFSKRSQRADDATAMQAVLCILLSAGLFAAHLFAPETANPVFRLIKSLSSSENELFTNPLGLIGGLL